MKTLSVKDQTFLDAARELIGDGEMLVVVRYVYAGGDRDFLFFRDFNEFRSMLAKLRHRDSVVLMKTFRSLFDGKVDGQYISAACASYELGKDWILLDKDRGKYKSGYYPIASRVEVEEELNERMGHRVRIIEGPHYANDRYSIGAYVPDEDGVVRPGAY